MVITLSKFLHWQIPGKLNMNYGQEFGVLLFSGHSVLNLTICSS